MNSRASGQQQTFSCSICTKNFTNTQRADAARIVTEKSQSRHISYCRKSIGRVRSRKRACQACTKAKARCDEAQPCCSRCSARGVACDYYVHDSRPRPSTISRARHEVGANSVAGYGYGGADLVCSNSGGVHVLDYPEAIDTGSRDRLLQSIRSSIVETSGSAVDISQYQLETDVYSYQILSSVPRVFAPRSIGGHKSSLHRSYLLCALRSYPQMMLRGQSPPFIHAQSISDDSDDLQLRNNSTTPGPLAVCGELLRMHTMKNEDNVVQIWGAIRREQERLLMEGSGYDYRDTLAALQAVSIYFVLRIFEQNEEATNFDIPLVQTMLELSIHLVQLRKSQSKIHTSQWEDWVFMESSSRTVLLFFLIDLLFEYSSAVTLFHHCTGREMLSRQLPSTRNLWQASSRTEWEREYEMQCCEALPFTYSDLIEYGPRNDGSLDFWLTEIDEFGNLVIAAASLDG
ncbi:hypothetical protein UA08_04905 [Talaromyces atroroseus]|uniref:Zn(2)-C6 fungal-type domain-containing protein n=1 Tax=Talaromyces atroroseus TaxID=1441469 RepID=A0A225B2X4_TALAT|nr:hypothetical protein UA08_04905 [Talaromyces atroroseus]OKL60207.1 hypothetical protein UA08_04905 [Talaromyces atroroseus]